MHGVRIVDVSNESESKITTKYPKIVTLRYFIPYSITSYKVWLVGELNEIKTVSLKVNGSLYRKGNLFQMKQISIKLHNWLLNDQVII